VHIGSELHLEAHDFDVLTEELVYQSVLLHNLQDMVDEAHVLPRAFQMPHQLMEYLNGCFLLPAPPGRVFDEVPHHFEVLKSSPPIFLRKLVRVPVDKAAFLGGEGSLEVVPEADCIAEVGGPLIKYLSSGPFFSFFGLTAVLKILSFGALALGDNIANL
jgi:hypothetical protein